MTDKTAALIAERGRTHGDYAVHAGCTQQLKDTVELWLRESSKGGPESLPYVVRESLDMILHKIGRVVAGQAMFRDHWDDIAGYARLVAERCE